MTTVDLHYKKNNEAHRTNEISIERLIIRRGLPFLLTLHSSSTKTLSPKSLEFTVQTGPKPSGDLGTKSVFGVSQKSVGKKPWETKVQETSGTSVTLAIKSPADASIGKYTFSVKTHPNATEAYSTGTFVLLFNPWCKEDTVYLENEAERQEYVMNEQGMQYRGTCDYIQGSAWDFGQFEEDILDICLKILDLNPKCAGNAAEDFSARGDPIYVGRVVSSMINSNDDRGVLQGNWTCAFFDGVNPTKWTGSVDILRQWNASDARPVKYGQCWVYGGVMCTVMRCLGIPCRLVTNFECACDSHGNLLIDFYISENGTENEEMNEDSIWNYHVWVEAWMKRPDLPGGSLYDGWQAVDPTPQELSDGVYCCGPAPVKAIREGHMDVKYDLPFIFAEVNADRVTWKIKPDGSHVKMHTDTRRVGKKISTKSVGSNERLDITGNYKYPEGSSEEREAFKEAQKRTNQLKKPEAAEEEPPPEISVEIEERSIPIMGNDIDLVIKLKGHTPRNLMIFANAKVKLYNGKLQWNICSEEQKVQLPANKELMVPFKIPHSKYQGHLMGNNSIKVMAVVDYKENREDVYLAEKNIALESPPFSLTVNENPKQFRNAQAELTFENPWTVDLTNCVVTFSGSGLLTESATTKFQSLGPTQLVRVILKFMPYRTGPRALMASFDCDQFQNIWTSCLSRVDLHSEKNNKAHRTNEISTERLIVRRAQPFLLTLHSSSPANLNTQFLELTVQTGSAPSEHLGTKSVFGVSRESVGKKPWEAKVQETSGTSVTLAIKSPADASIGKYTFSVKTHPNATESQSVGTFVLLFNPWCTEDGVFLANEEERLEYVMNEQGLLYKGISNHIVNSFWDFGQFEEDILDICLKILDLNPKHMSDAAQDVSARSDPIYVGRVVSAMVNASGDRGVLEGRWGANFFGGVPPTHWNGSVDILRRWNKYYHHPVKYGQCWVFAAVMCTVLRCLGIPCRPVTNFESAHDTHGNLIIDEYYSDRGVKPKESHDSVWNFHVWVEGWMRRPDLQGNAVYDGWQVLDPTPQELSDGVHCCGPASVKAVQAGHTDLEYDLPFVFAEVNADRIAWLLMADGSQKAIYSDTKSVGQNISTKSVGSDKRLNITGNYKHPEGTDKERKAFKEAVRRTERLKEPQPTPADSPPEISITIEEHTKPVNGKDIDLLIRLRSPTPRNLLLHANAQVMLYFGILESDIWNEEKPVQLLAGQELTVPFQIPFSKYGSHLQGNNSIKVTAVAEDKETDGEKYMAEANIVPEDPPLNITVTGNPAQFGDMMVKISFANPLPTALKNCVITASGSGLIRRTVEAKLPLLGQGRMVLVQVPFTPYKAGTKMLLAEFDCDQFRDIQTSYKINIKPAGLA